MSLEKIKTKIDKLLVEKRVAESVFETARTEYAGSIKRLVAAEDAQRLAQSVAAQVQQQAHNRIAGVVSKCLESVFDEPYTFKIDFQQKRGKTEAVLAFERAGETIDPLTSSGGGVIDVSSFALRLSSLVLRRPPVRKVLVLDEPFKFLSAEYRERLVGMLTLLTSEFGMQFIMVTHIRELEIGKVLHL
jgi:DNA repair exonuclease SbcCD ATPase subunit